VSGLFRALTSFASHASGKTRFADASLNCMFNGASYGLHPVVVVVGCLPTPERALITITAMCLDDALLSQQGLSGW